MDTIIYHGDCPDGFCAAYILRTRAFRSATLVPAVYGVPTDPAHIADKKVIVVDFSWKREETERLKALASDFVVLDHHQTAEAELAGLSYCTFDMARSGAQLAWDYVFGDQPRPWFVDYVADRDLWKWALPDSKTVSAYIMALPHAIEAWAALERLSVAEAAALGTGVRLQIEHYIEKVCVQARPGVIGAGSESFTCAAVNAPYTNISDVANRLCEQGADVGIGWFLRGDGLVQFSLRSVREDIDVSKLAKGFGGGGHKHAAGFTQRCQNGFYLLKAIGVLPL